MQDQAYNGWTNYETWLTVVSAVDSLTDTESASDTVMRWWPKDERGYPELYDQDKPMPTSSEMVERVADGLREMLYDIMLDDVNDLQREFLLAVLSEVDWRQIAQYIWDSSIDESVSMAERLAEGR